MIFGWNEANKMTKDEQKEFQQLMFEVEWGQFFNETCSRGGLK